MNSQSILNRFKQIFVKKPEDMNIIPKETSNPYVAARFEWNSMMSDIIKAKYNWQMTSLVSLVVNCLLSIGCITIGLKAHFVPYIVEVDAVKNASFYGKMDESLPLSPDLIRAQLRRFIIAARSIIADEKAERHQLEFVYGSSNGTATTRLNDYYQQLNPFEAAKSHTIDVAVHSMIPLSKKTWQIDWTEIQYDASGRESQRLNYEAILTVTQKKMHRLQDLMMNPLGLYVTNISWTQTL